MCAWLLLPCPTPFPHTHAHTHTLSLSVSTHLGSALSDSFDQVQYLLRGGAWLGVGVEAELDERVEDGGVGGAGRQRVHGIDDLEVRAVVKGMVDVCQPV